MIFFFRGFLFLGIYNLTSLVGYSYPVTTTLAFNLALASSLWAINVIFLGLKLLCISSFLPSNSPWYLVPFLSFVEIIRVIVRPLTLCFRLLANIRAGHILLSLICGLPFFFWLFRGVLFGLLELIVAIIQSFVFFILVGVYFEERINHSGNSLKNVALKKLKNYELEKLILIRLLTLFFTIFLKWTKTLLVIILMEGFTALILSLRFSFVGGIFFPYFILFIFCEWGINYFIFSLHFSTLMWSHKEKISSLNSNKNFGLLFLLPVYLFDLIFNSGWVKIS